MTSTTPVEAAELVTRLRGYSLRVRTGLWLLPVQLLQDMPNEAARLGIEAVDCARRLLAELPTDTRFVGLNSARIIELLDVICLQNQSGDCLLIFNLDLLVARLRQRERNEVWMHLYSSFSHRSRGLLIAMPQGANALLPGGNGLTAWRRDGRLAESPIRS